MAQQKPIIVIKIGTHALLGDHESPHTTFGWMVRDTRQLLDSFRVIIVTSGAIGFGARALGLSGRPRSIESLQALAMIGQTGLLARWQKAFGDVVVGQILVTRQELTMDATIENLRKSIEALWQYGAIPIVNENDAISHEEISFGDNDQLAAEIANVLSAEKLIFVTNEDGVIAHYGTTQASRLTQVSVGDPPVFEETNKSQLGTGGIGSKLMAAGFALGYGVEAYIGKLSEENGIQDILSGRAGTKIIQ